MDVLAAGAEAGGAPVFMLELVVLLAAAAVIAYLCQRIGLVAIVGFLLAGVLVGPNALGLIRSVDTVEQVAEIGVILLLFSIGMELSIERLVQLRRLVLAGGALQVGLTTALVTGILALAGVDLRTGIYSGFLVALSSTAIVLTVLGTRGERSAEHGRIGLSLLVFQDLAIVAMVLVVPMLSGHGGDALDLLWAVAKAGLIILVVMVGARRVMPRVLESVARTCSPEVFLLTTVAICFGTAWLTSLAGVSVSLGAFLAGLIVSESHFEHQALGEILPLQTLFSAAFFVSVGMLLDVGFVVTHLPIVALVVLAVLAVKTLATTVGLLVLRLPLGLALAVGLMLAQVGEFSFVLEGIGREGGLSPFGLGEDGDQAFIAATVLLMIATPFLTRAGLALGGRVPAIRPGTSPPPVPSAQANGDRRDHVVVAGYGNAARTLAGVLQRTGTGYLITTLNPDGANEAEERGHPVVRGDASRRVTLEAAGVAGARVLVVPDDEPEMAGRVAATARTLNPALQIVVRAGSDADVDRLRTAGADDIVTAEGSSAIALLVRVLQGYDVDHEDIWAEVRRATQTADVFGAKLGMSRRIELHPSDGAACGHLDTIQPVRPSAPGCEECLRLGHRWVHLRVCMRCGHVGCCDSSPGRHATAHWHETEHPIVKSGEPGEEWGWCYPDKLRV
jgi:CPA2 family monovalent cation:H+ antiporter-2